MSRVGLVIGTKSASPLEFWVGVEKGNYLQLDDVVVVVSKVDGLEENNGVVTFYGIVNEVQKAYEGIEFDTDASLVTEGWLAANIAYIGKVFVTRIEPEIFVPPQPGDEVCRAKGANLEKALYFDGMEKKIPAGIMRNGEIAYINFDFMNGTKGGHISISGISGVATKTSYALFLLHSIFNSKDLDSAEKANTKAIIFNVKGEDLLFLDKENKLLKNGDKELYKKLGLPPSAFKSVQFYAPPKYPPGVEYIPDVEQRKDGIIPYLWSMRSFADEELLPFLFTEGTDGTDNLSFAIQMVKDKLKQLANKSKEGELRGPDEKFIITSLDEIKMLIEDEVDKTEGYFFPKSVATATRLAFLRRFEAGISSIKAFVHGSEHPPLHKINWEEKQITVIDINKLNSRGKMFVVGAVLRKMIKEKEAKGSRPWVFVVLDELNKYAPKGAWSPIKEVILDIAERGRSLGVILLGAQQTASEVEGRVVGNASVKVTGRLDTAEVTHSEYDYLIGTFKQRVTIIKPGTMIVHQPELPSPLLINFPFAAWATRKAEEKIPDETIKEWIDKI